MGAGPFYVFRCCLFFIGTQDGFAVCRNKSNKNAFFLFRLLCAQGLYPANQAAPRAVNSCPTAFALWPTLQQIFTMPQLALEANKFCLLSREASCKYHHVIANETIPMLYRVDN